MPRIEYILTRGEYLHTYIHTPRVILMSMSVCFQPCIHKVQVKDFGNLILSSFLLVSLLLLLPRTYVKRECKSIYIPYLGPTAMKVGRQQLSTYSGNTNPIVVNIAVVSQYILLSHGWESWPIGT